MEFRRLTADTDPYYEAARALYQDSFPRHEQRESASQRTILACPDYHFNLIFDDGRWVGLLLCWKWQNTIYVEHFCILPQLRGQQYGQRALALLAQEGKTVILEIDPPAPSDPIAQRRKEFYERCGYRENPFPHVHPPYHADCGGHALVVMSASRPLTQREYDDFAAYLQNTVMAQ